MLLTNKYNPQPLTARHKAYLRSIADDPEEQIAECECGKETSQAQIDEHGKCPECMEQKQEAA